MPAAFLHGVEVFEYNNGPAPITVVKSAVIGLVGSAPAWAVAANPALWQPNWIVVPGQQVVDSNGNVQQVSSLTLLSWVLSTAKVVGNLIVDSNGNTQRCTTAGTTGSGSHPAWATAVGSTTTDGSVVWTLIALGSVGVTGSTPPVWGTTLNSTVTEGSQANVTWKLVKIGSLYETPTLVNFTSLSSVPGSAGQFGPMIQGYTIPYALNFIQAQGAGQVIVMNVFNPYTHMTSVAAQAFSMPASGAQAISLGHMGVWGVVVTNSGGTATYVNGFDYTLDPINGVILAKAGGTITTGEALLVTFNYADPSKVADSDLVGTGNLGIQGFLTTYGIMGFWPKILMAPSAGSNAGQSVGSADAVVAAALLAVANKIRATVLVDCVPGTTPAAALANRGNSAQAFDTSSDRMILCCPCQQFTDLGIIPTGVTLSPSGTGLQNVSGLTAVGPLSMWAAGAMAAKDLNFGYWYSPSNTMLIGTLGGDVPMYQSYLDSASDTNNLNEAGIVTVFNAFGSGLRLWGNRSAAYPTYTTPDNFISVRRTMDVIEESVQLAMLQFIDQPINNALISTILASVNAFLRSLVGKGALIGTPVASYNPAENPTNQIANGQLVFDIDCMPPPPAERLSFNVYVDTTQLASLTGSISTTGTSASPQ